MNGPLPRSLAPAAGELLPGYLLRLAHRIGATPIEVGQRCGLTTGNLLPARHLVRLDAGQVRQVAEVCRLSRAEVEALTLAGQAPNYTPLHVNYLGRHQSPITMANDGWVFTAFSRYCPDCLADTVGLPGGPVWHGSWRLPHTYLCARHERVLDWRCPACQAPAFSNGYRPDGRWRPTQLVPAPGQRLHPAECRHRPGTGRSPACSHRLDQPGVAERPTPAMLHAHERLAAACTAPPGHTIKSLGGPTSPKQFFNDVRATALALCATWPAAAALLPGHEYLDAVAAHAETLHRTPAERAGPQNDGWLSRTVDHPPASPDRAAAVFTLVVELLDGSAGRRVLSQLMSDLPSAEPGYRRLKQLAPHCSANLRDAIVESTRLRYGGVGPRPLFPQPLSHQGRLDPERIPAVLPEAWAAPLDALGGPTRQLRRDAAIRLVQMAQGGSRAAAARLLGITPGVFHATTLCIRTWQKKPGNAEAYQKALHRIAEIAPESGNGAPIAAGRDRGARQDG
ncbi:TniQ family protein [Streptomyces sp. NPDC058746]|uniref:TniQ family protein n=1 Tax=Streptomyces sp. NPDC058746 TaxID=3346622 RepID=UPI0036A9ADB4